jgi:TonB family protein
MVSRDEGAELNAPKLNRLKVILTLSLAFFLSSAGSWGQEGRKLVRKVDPVYPELARKMNLSGIVKVEFTIAQDGSVKDVQVLGGSPLLAASVQDAVKQWKYASGPSESKKTLEFKF